jgi:hypothetical protein
VEGTYNGETNTLTARKVKLDDEGPSQVQIRGAASDLNNLQGTFKITALSFSGLFVPPGSQMVIATTIQTEFLGNDNQTLTKEQFFTAAATAAAIEVEGTFNTDQNQILAKKIKIEGDLNANQVEVDGPRGADHRRQRDRRHL